MSVFRALAGRWLDLPPPRCSVERSSEWVAMEDGTRLATTLFRPVTPEPRAVVLQRTISPTQAPRRQYGLLAQLLAEQGHVVVMQQCRGLQDSEGSFEPFRHDGDDGAATLDWLSQQPGCGGPVALLGLGYAGHAAWATLAKSRRPVAALIVAFGARDPFAWLHAGGALELSCAFDLALSLATAEPEGARTRDLARALRFRPVREADRVASRRIDWLREWLDHPERDDFWESLAAPLPEHAPEALLIGGWHHATLSPLIDDHATLTEIAERRGTPRPRLLVGPWAAVPLPRRERPKGTRLAREIARSTVALLDRVCGATSRPAAPVRAFAYGRGWRETAQWPPAAEELVLYLNGDGRDGGLLAATAPDGGGDGDAPSDAYVYDPADATGSANSAITKPANGTAEGRGDMLRYASEPAQTLGNAADSSGETGALELAGPVCVELFATSDAAHTDFSALLSRVGSDGNTSPLTEGIARVAMTAGAPTHVAIELAPRWQRLEAGDRLRLEISSSCFPRFDRHPNTAEAPAAVRDDACRPALQRIHHDEEHPSRLRLRVARA